ncbi:MAG: metallophosphoesterase [Phycisphaerae bacterium]
MNDILLAHRHHHQPKKARLKHLIWTAAGSCALGGLFAWRLEDHWLRIEHTDMPLENLGKGFDGARLIHISDLHCSPIVLERYLHQCVERVNALEPDFVVITGDFITGLKTYARRVARVLHELHPKVATLACLGNHDYGILHPRGFGMNRGLAQYLTERLGHADIFVMLNESRRFRRDGSVLQFAGVEDFWSGRFDPAAALEFARTDRPVIGLCHNPDGATVFASRGADWVLAGHTHGTGADDRGVYDVLRPSNHSRFYAGLYDLDGGKKLYVNRGLGYARRLNLNARPEITVFTLRDS